MAAESGGPVVIRSAERTSVAAALEAGGVGVGVEVLVVVGGAGGMTDAVTDELTRAVREAVIPTVMRRGLTVVDGGTDSGVMRSVGRARAASGAQFPLVGVVAEGTVTLPGAAPPRADAAELEGNHTHVLLVPGSDWGAEAPWIADVAGVVAAGRGSVTMLVNGGDIAFDDAARSLAAGRPLVVVARTGRTADAIADARTSGAGDPRARRIASSPLTHVVRLDEPGSLASALVAGLAAPVGQL